MLLRDYSYKYLVTLVSLVAICGSLYFSEVIGFIPCNLCWWQRLFMYPIFVLGIIGLFRNNNDLIYYVLPLSLIGMCVSINHIYLQFSNVESNICVNGVPCHIKYIEWFGFITIPVLCFIAFFIINITLLYKLFNLRRFNMS